MQGPPGQPPSGGPPNGGGGQDGPPQGHGAPAQGQGHGAPPQGQGAPPQGYAGAPQGYPPPPQGYGPPPQGYAGAPQGYPPPQQGYGAPPQHGYGAPPGPPPGYPAQQGYGAPPQGYGQPPGYGAPPQGYGPPPGYGAHPMPGQYGGAPGRRAAAVRLNGGLYVALNVLSMVALYAIVALASNRASEEAAVALPLPMLVSGIAMMVFLYKMWSAIDDGVTRPTPGAALGCLFIPLFSIYWLFVVWPGYATAYNAYIQRHGIRAQPLSMGFILCTILLAWVPIVGLVLMCINLSRIAAAVNALSDSGLPAARAISR